MSKVPIPSDWNGTDWTFALVCWPDSQHWRELLLGLITTPTRGRWYDEKTGSITAAQAIGWQIFEKNNQGGVLLSCQDLITAVNQVAQAVQAIEAAQIDIKIANQAQAEAASVLNAQVTATAQSVAISQAWAYAVATATAEITLYNNVSLTIGPVGPALVDPIVELEPATGIGPTPQAKGYCDVAQWIVDGAIAWVKALQAASIGLANLTITAAFGLASEALAAVQFYLGPAAAPIAPTSVLAGMASSLVALALKGVLNAQMTLLADYLEANRSEWICQLYLYAGGHQSTAQMAENLEDTLRDTGFLLQETVELALGFFNPPMLALFYYTSSLVTIPDGVFDCGPCGGA